MSRWLPWILTALGAFIAFALFLNLREKDYYENGSLTPVAGDPSLDPTFKLLVPEQVTHACPTCGDCVHPVEILENRRTLSLRDHDGWYKLFWAADEVYYFDDPLVMAACLENRTAKDPAGSWTIRARIGEAMHQKGTTHDCGEMITEFQFRFALSVREDSLEESSMSLYPYLQVPETVQAFVRPYVGDSTPPLLRFYWRLGHTPDVSRPAPCPCGKS